MCRTLTEDHFWGRGHVEVEAQLLWLLRLHGPSSGVGGVQQHLQLVVGCVGSAEGRVVEDPEFLADVFNVHLHLLHGAVENALRFLHRERDLFGHEVAVVDGNPGPAEKRSIKTTPKAHLKRRNGRYRMFTSPVMLPKEACVHLTILFSKCFGWPERKALQLSPDQGVGLTLIQKTNTK